MGREQGVAVETGEDKIQEERAHATGVWTVCGKGKSG